MVEDSDSERLTDVLSAVIPSDSYDDPLGMHVGPGTEVGGYVIDGELGHGGMGVVYSATHPVIGKRAAIKILRPDVSRSPIAVERFIQEARAVNKIGHPNIIDIFAYGALPDGRAYHVMDLLVGESLRRRIKRSVMHPSEAASVIDEVASALTAAHEHGFVHRDLKPDNVFLVAHDGRWPEVKLLDFGLAKLMPEHGVAAFTTKAGAMLGTPQYMSPEQARGKGVDYRTDVYALGVVMFEMLAGARPFPMLADSFATLLQHAEEPPMSLADVVAGLPAEMVQLVDAMLAKTPEARPSLAAVRTVIKRLRTTQLPTRSLAGQALGSFGQPGAVGLSASTVGAEAVVPDPGRAHRASRPPPLSPAALAAQAPRPMHGEPDASRAASNPNSTTPGVGVDKLGLDPQHLRILQQARRASASGAASPAAIGAGSPVGAGGAPPTGVLAQAEHAPSTRMPSPQQAGLPGAPGAGASNAQSGAARPGAGLGFSQVGVQPLRTGAVGTGTPPPHNGVRAVASGVGDPVRTSQRIATTEMGVPPPPRASGIRPVVDAPPVTRWWLMLALLVAASVAIAAVIALTG